MKSFKKGDEPELMMREYKKMATVQATQMNEDFEVETAQGNIAKGAPGDYLCKGPHGDMWPCRKDIFEDTYRLVVR